MEEKNHIKDVKKIVEIIENSVSLIEILKFFKIKFQMYFDTARFKAVWRNNKKNSVAINLHKNTFIDYGDGNNTGGVIKLYYLLKKYDEEFEDIFIEIINDIVYDLNLKKILALDSITNIDNYIYDLKKKHQEKILIFDQEKQKNVVIQTQEINKKYFDIAKPASLHNLTYFKAKKLPLSNLDGQIKEIVFNDSIVEKYVKKELNSQQNYDFKFHNCLIMPIFDIQTKKLISLQYFFNPETLKLSFDIFNKNYSTKEFHFQTQTSRGCFILNKFNKKYNQEINYNKIIFIAEGLATGLSVFYSLMEKYTVIVALNSGNLKHIVEFLKTQTSQNIIIISDKDKTRITKNAIKIGVGQEAALKLSENYSNVYVFLPITHFENDNTLLIKKDVLENNNIDFWRKKRPYISDFCDIFTNYGIKACRFNIFLNFYFLNKLNNLINCPEIYFSKNNNVDKLINKLEKQNPYEIIIYKYDNNIFNYENIFEKYKIDFFSDDKKELINKILNFL